MRLKDVKKGQRVTLTPKGYTQRWNAGLAGLVGTVVDIEPVYSGTGAYKYLVLIDFGFEKIPDFQPDYDKAIHPSLLKEATS